jgi:hypothetical protein
MEERACIDGLDVLVLAAHVVLSSISLETKGGKEGGKREVREGRREKRSRRKEKAWVREGSRCSTERVHAAGEPARQSPCSKP